MIIMNIIYKPGRTLATLGTSYFEQQGINMQLSLQYMYKVIINWKKKCLLKYLLLWKLLLHWTMF